MKKTGFWIMMLLLSANTAFANVSEGQFTVSPQVGGYTFDSKQHLKTYPVYGIRLGYNFSDHIGVEGGIDYALTKSTSAWYNKKVDLYKLNADLLYHFMPGSSLVPYLAVGGGAYSLYGPSYIVSKETKGLLDYGAGLKLFMNDRYAVRADARHVIAASGTDKNSYNNFEYTLGVLVSFGGSKPAAKVAAPAEQTIAQPAAAAAAVVTEEKPAAACPPCPEPVPVKCPEPQPTVTRVPVLAPVPVQSAAPAESQSVVAAAGMTASKGAPVIHNVVVGSNFIEIQGDRPLDSFLLYAHSKPLRQVIDFPGATTDMTRKTVQVNKFGITQATIESDPAQVRITLNTKNKKYPLYWVESKGNSMKILFVAAKAPAKQAKKAIPAAKK